MPKNSIGITQIDVADDFIELIFRNDRGESAIYVDKDKIESSMTIFTNDPEVQSKVVIGTRIPYPHPDKIPES